MINQNPHITADNMVEELSKQVKHYDKEIMYKFKVGNEYCYPEILINDVPVYKEFKEPLSSTTFDINHAVFKSGSHKLTYKIYPVGKIEDSNVAFNTLIQEFLVYRVRFF